MDKREEEDFDQEFDENGFDPTKEAFFSDLMGMEEDIASEAYELVEHAINLINSKYYDDGIEILRQAIGLYTQINREEEIKAINEKISEIYILKEQAFREEEIEVEKLGPIEIKEEASVSDLQVELAQEEIEVELLEEAVQLIKEGKVLLENNRFEETLDKYDEATEIFEKMGKKDEAESVFKLIEECYNKKAEFLRSVKSPLLEAVMELEQREIIGEEHLKEEKLRQYLDAKKRGEEISSQAYELLGKAAELAKNKQYDEALQIYREGSKLFEELNWEYEVNKVQETISQLEKERSMYLMELEKVKIEKIGEIELQTQQEEIIEDQIMELEEQEKAERLERLKGIELQKMETEFFKVQIDNMATEASRMAREYELAMQKAIKKGEMMEECMYPQVIEIYKRIKELLIDKGWRSEAAIYDDTIDIYIQKFEQDKKIRQIEVEKVIKQKETEEMLKISKDETRPALTEEQIRTLEEQHKKEIEIQNLRTQIEEMTMRAEKLAREYEIALRKGKFGLKCPYSEIINIFKTARQFSLEKGWETDAAIFLSQIQAYKEKLEKDNKLRQIEAEKLLKQSEAEDLSKKQKEEKKTFVDEEQLRKIEEQKRLEEDQQNFAQLINDMVNKAEKVGREYDSDMKKAVREGKLAENPPFKEIIKIYEKVRQLVLEKGKIEEVSIYDNQINYYSQKWEKDNKLREVEAQKIQKQKELEEMLKIGKTVDIEEEKLRAIDKKREEEDFKNYIAEMVDNAEKLVREYEIYMRKSMKKGKILESTPYPEVIEIYKQIRDKVYTRGWKEQAEIFGNQIKIYQDKLEKHEKLLEVEAEKIQRQKDLEDMHKVEKIVERDKDKLKQVDKKKEEEDFKKYIAEMVDNAEKLVREHESEMRKSMKKGEILENTPYLEVIEIYKQIRDKVYTRGWKEQAEIFGNQIKIYQDKLEKHEKLFEVEAEKIQRQKDLEDMHKIEKIVERDQDKLKQLEKKKEEEDFKKYIAEMVDDAEKLVREHEIKMRKSMKKGEILENTPYLEVIEIYKQIRDKVYTRGWKEQAEIFGNQIKIYQDKLEKHERLFEVEAEKIRRQKDLEDMHKVEKTIETDQDKLKQVDKKKEEENFEKYINGMVDNAEKLVREHESEMRKSMKKGEILESTPYSEVIEIYKQIRDKVYARGWKEQAEIYRNQIKIYQDKLEKHEKLLEVEAEKVQRQKDLEDMHKVEKTIETDQEKLKQVEKKKEEEDFEKYINGMVDTAEKLVREHESEMRKSMKSGEILESTPYSEVIEIYKQIRDKVYARGWKDQVEMFENQIKIYQDKLEKHEKLLEVEAEKVQRQKDLEDMHKVEKTIEIDKDKLKQVEKKKEEEDFEKYINGMVDNAEKLIREHESEMRKSMKKGEILENTPYPEVIETYKQIREKVYAQGWKEQAEIYGNQIKIYHDKLEKHEKLLEVEAEKIQRQKDLEDMHKVEKTIEIDKEKLKQVEKKKEEKDFEKYITGMVNKAEKLEREYNSAMKKALKKGKIIEQTPYQEIIGIYHEIQDQLLERGWIEQSQIYSNQIKIYQEKINQSEKLREVETKKVEREKELEEILKAKEEFKPARPDKIKELDAEVKEEDILLDKAMGLIDEAERLVKNYEVNIKTDVLLYESPYEKAIANYNEAKKLFQEIGWNDEAGQLINTVKFYKEKEEKDEKLREIEKKKLEEPEAELITAKTDTEKELFAKEKKILEFEKKKKDKEKQAEKIFNEIHKAEKLAKEYELKIKEDLFEQEPPYDKILKIYREARKSFEEIGWMEESMRLLNTIQFYKEKLEKDKRLRSLEIERAKKQEEELLMQQRLLKQAKVEQERLLKKRKESLLIREEKVSEFETAKNRAFNLMDQAKKELNQNNFDQAIDLYKESEQIFLQIEWQEGINMVKDSISMIKERKKSFELELAVIEDKKLEQLKIEEQLEEKLVKAEELRKLQQEEKRKELLKIQREKEWEKEISDQAYRILEQGTALLDKKNFDKAYEKYIEARKLFDKISWKREVSRINNDLLFKLKRERKTFEIFEGIKKKKVEEELKMELLKKEVEKERDEHEKRKKEEKRKLAKEEFDKKIFKEIQRAEKQIEIFKYNEGILILRREIQKLDESEHRNEIERIDKLINKVKDQTEVPLIVLESLDVIDNLGKFKAAYLALDKAQMSLMNNSLMKAVSELKESIFHLKDIKISKKYLDQIDEKIGKLQERLGKKPKAREKEYKDEKEILKARIEARRKERRKKVLDLLGRNKD